MLKNSCWAKLNFCFSTAVFKQFTVLVGYKEYKNINSTFPLVYQVDYEDNTKYDQRNSCYFLCVSIERNDQILFDNKNFLKHPFIDGDLIGINDKTRHYLEVYVAKIK